MKLIVGTVVLFECLIGSLCGSVSRGALGEVALFGAPAAFDVETMVALNDAGQKDKEVGYKIKAALQLLPLWTGPERTEFLLKFVLLKPKLYLRGKHLNADFRPFDSIWDSYRDTDFYVHWKSGTIQTAYLDPTEPVDVLNYKKSLISLFQFQIIDGEYNETDISGTCDVLYDSISTEEFRKIKRGCVLAGSSAAWDAGLEARRVTRYALGADGALRSVYADELLALGGAALGVKARGWTRLQPGPAPPAAAAAPALADALRALPPRLQPAPLALAGDDLDDDHQSLEEALEAHRSALETEEAGAGGGVAQARAALALLPALRAAPAPALRALLAAAADTAYPQLSGVCRMLGLAGTRAAHAAADGFLHLGARDPLLPFALHYLAGFGLAAAPEPGAAADVARLAADARSPALADAALLAAAAAAARLPAGDLRRDLRDDIARSLARCKDDACRAVRLQALGHLRREDSAELLLEHLERGGRAAGAAAAAALGALPPAALHIARRRRLERVALGGGRALEVRAAALDLLLRRSVRRPLPLAETAAALHRYGPVELRRLFWQRLRGLAEDHPDVRDLIDMLPRELKTWDAQAHGGTSMALERGTGWARGGWAARLGSLQAAARGLLRRGAVALTLHAPDNSTADLLAVEVWTRGLEAVAGGSGPADPALDEGEADDEVAGGLDLAVAGVRLPAVSLFAGQAELLGHVWAGTGSAPTPALRAVAELGGAGRGGAVPLAGGARVRLRRRGALALALDAQAQVSLWSRSARAALELRAAAAGEARALLRAAWGRLEVRVAADAEPRLRIAADLDFYDAVALCVRVRLDDFEHRHYLWQESRQGARGLRVVRARNSTTRAPGRTLALGRAPDAACKALTAPGDD